MARIPFPNGFEGSEDLPRTRRSLQNCWKNKQGRLIGRPGILGGNIVANGLARAAFVWNESLYMVFSQDLIKITDTTTLSFSVIGTIAGPQAIETAVGFNEAVIVVKGGAIYTLDKTDTLVDISGNANFVSCADVAHIDSRFVYIPADGSPAFFSDVGDAGSVQALSFFDAEVLPDKNNAVFVFRNTLYIMGTDSIELFDNQGGTPVPFVRRGGGAIDNGFIGGLLEYNNTFLFIGREKNQDFGIYAIGQGIAPKISNEAIDLILSTYTLNELSEAIPGRFKWRGDDIATFTLRRDSFGFLRGNWFLLDTVFSGISRPWGAGFIVQFEGEYFTAFEDKIGKFSKGNTDYGERITRIIDFGIEQPDVEFFSVQDIELGISQGFNPVLKAISLLFFDDAFGNFDDAFGNFDDAAGSLPLAVGSVSLFLSRDNVLYGNPLTLNLGNSGQYGQKLRWNYPGGLGTYQGFMGARILTTEDIIFSDDYITINARGQLQT